MIITAKLIAIGLSLALTAFTVSTIVLAVQNSNLQDDLDEMRQKRESLEEALKTTTTTTTNVTSNPSTTTPEPTTPGQTTPGQTTPGQTTPGQTTPGQTTPGQTTPGQTTPGQTTPEPPTPEPTESTTTPAPTTPGQTTPGQTTPGQTTPGQTTPEPEITTESPQQPINYRLPDTMKPTHYDLYLHPEIETGNFTGQTIITITVLKPTDKIILHSHRLEISNVWLLNPGSSTIFVKNKTIDLVREFLVIELSEIMQPRTFRLGIIFSGNMNGKTVGLYTSSYLKEDGSRKTIATSQCEPTYARQAYPCFDEPNMKATFAVTLLRPMEGDYHALSNMNAQYEIPQGDYVEVFFKTSVPMSTYLTCFIVSDFSNKEKTIDTKGIGAPFLMRVFASPAQIDKVDFGLEMGAAVIEYFIDYFQVEYPLPKFDMAGIPDFDSGAMENWGLVTYREVSLLYNAQTSSTANKQRVASVVAHEIAHMWFGNLVTMDWWNDLWLNEGFARYMENKGIEAKYPEWKMLDQFIVDVVQLVFSLDAALGSHPIVQTVQNPDQITEIFDKITYSKGASIIRMLENFVKPEIFRTGVTNYLNEFKYKNAVTDDFLTVMAKLVEFDLKAIMRTWTEQMGLPVVEVQQLSSTQYKLTQKRFLSNPEDYDVVHAKSPFNYKWSIPITYTTSANAEEQLEWFYYTQDEITITLPSEVSWIRFNKEQVGYYRVNYQTEMWKSLADTLVATPAVFSIGDRASILNDAFSLADSTQLSYDTALDMTKYLEKEEDYLPWRVASFKLTSLKRTLMFTSTFTSYIAYARKLIEPAYSHVGWTPDKGDNLHLKNRLRVIALGAACSLGLEVCLEEVSGVFKNWLANPTQRPHADLREIIYYYGIMHEGTEQVWDQVLDLFFKEEDSSEKNKLMYGLSSIQVPWILSKFVDLAWNESNVRGQDYFTCLKNIAANPIGEPIVWEYVRENWPNLVNRFGLNDRHMGNMIPVITSHFHTKTKLDEMNNFFTKYPEAGAGTAARVRALEHVKNKIVWLDQNREKIANWLASQQLK